MEDNNNVVTATETAEQEQVQQESTKNDVEDKKEKTYSRAEVNKMINAEREKLKLELQKEAEVQKSEAEKLAKMDTEQKLNYKIEQLTNELNEKNRSIHTLTLTDEANKYATEQGLPLGYLSNFDFANETADSIKEKIDNLSELRKQDMASYLNDKLKQTSPKAVDSKKEVEDPFIMGFKAYKKNK